MATTSTAVTLRFGGAQNDLLYGGIGMDLMHGGDGSDVVYGELGDDTLDGGTGNDTLIGGTGDDTYHFGRGFGRDVISEEADSSGSGDIALIQSAASDQLWFSRIGNDLNIEIVGTDDRLMISNWYLGAAYRVETLQAADGKFFPTRRSRTWSMPWPLLHHLPLGPRP